MSAAQVPESDEPDRADEIAALRAELEAAKAAYEAAIQRIEERIAQLAGAEPPESPPESPEDAAELLRQAEEALAGEQPTTPPPAVSPPAPTTATTQTLNPQISANGDFVGSATKDAPDPQSLDLREVEIAFQSVIDPFARADIFVTIPSLERVEIEEGYITFLTLPSSFLARAGKVRVPFGRANVDHRPESFAVDRPDVITFYFGEEGLAEAGVTVSRLLPNPWDAFMELELDVLDGRNEESFGGGTAGDLLYNVHYRSFFDLTAEQNLNVGLSYLNGTHAQLDTPDNQASSQFEGMDVTYQWKPLRRGNYRSFLWQTEVMASQRELAVGSADTWGLYSFARYQLSRRGFVGAQFDYAQPPDAPGQRASAYSVILDFFPSEFQRFRAQYKFTDWRDGPSFQELFLQWYFLIGTHGAHKF